MHKTTLNINQDIFSLMEMKASSMGISITSLIKQVMARFSNGYTGALECCASSVAYQHREGAEWHVFPISYTDSEYEQSLDIRKIWKMSVSFFLAAAFVHFLQSIKKAGDERKELCNSYMLNDYAIYKKIVKNTLIIQIYWEKKEKTNQRE